MKYWSVLVLLLYIIVISPTALFHNHQSEIVAYEEADSCEKVVYYGEEAESCHHKEHISKPVKNCSLCDIHTPSNHEPTTFDYEFIKPEVKEVTIAYAEHVIPCFYTHVFSRGPPLFV